MKNKLLTVLTPTYNRVGLIERLYHSLINQTNKNFVWLIVDDGSKDGTPEILNKFILENKLNIKVIYQENSGKYVAHNTGVKNCETDLIVCVDSDDVLYPFAVEHTISFWEKYKNDADVAGIVSPKQMGDNSYFSQPPEKSSLMNLYKKHYLVGETMLVFRTEILKKYLFPEVKGEKFMSECVIYNQIDQKYVLAVQNEYLYKAEYQNDGITLNISQIHWKNPKTTLIMFRAQAAYQNEFLIAAKSYASYLAWRKARNLKDFEVYHVNMFVRIVGRILKPHYDRLFDKIKKEGK